MKESDIRNALLTIEATVRGRDFDSWREAFVRKHADSFTFADENKLIYTGTWVADSILVTLLRAFSVLIARVDTYIHLNLAHVS